MHSTDVVKKILHQNNFNNFEIKIKGRISKCAYNKEKTIIYICPEDNNDSANSLIVAAHEASHALNYREGVTNPSLLKFLEKAHKTIFIATLLIIPTLFFLELFNILQFPKTFIWSLIYLNGFFTILFQIYYTRDEAKTEKRAIIELQNIWSDGELDKNIFKINKKTLIWSIYTVTILVVPALVLAPYGLYFLLNLFLNLKGSL
ncbi:zinc metallopeptidase [Lysinibacillus sp. OL1]|uniref:zinc metallopeptidase n=1 Tax=Lysinibacillus sp. OL1 TaxID=2517243 RepID=UPI00187D6123|nr:zinc metallopeptidase [Lysinibacillus sp. OL1]